MPSASKRKGASWERDIVEYLRSRGYMEAERTRAGWQDDRGDIAGVPFTVEAKNAKQWDFPRWIEETVAETFNNGTRHGVLVVKRPRIATPAEAYAVQRFENWLDLFEDTRR